MLDCPTPGPRFPRGPCGQSARIAGPLRSRRPDSNPPFHYESRGCVTSKGVERATLTRLLCGQRGLRGLLTNEIRTPCASQPRRRTRQDGNSRSCSDRRKRRLARPHLGCPLDHNATRPTRLDHAEPRGRLHPCSSRSGRRAGRAVAHRSLCRSHPRWFRAIVPARSSDALLPPCEIVGAPYSGDVAIVLRAPAVAGVNPRSALRAAGERGCAAGFVMPGSRLPVRGRHVLDVLLYRGGAGLSRWLPAGKGDGRQHSGRGDADCDHQAERAREPWPAASRAFQHGG